MINLKSYTIKDGEDALTALIKINDNQQGFLIVLNAECLPIATLTDGDIRRGIIAGHTISENISHFYNCAFKYVFSDNSLEDIAELFKNQAVKFLPILNRDGKLCNIITKQQMHALLLQNIDADLSYDFSSLDVAVVDSEIYPKPWGFYKTTVLNDFYQSKVINVNPLQRLSLQSHRHREEHWIVVHGVGQVQLEDSVLEIRCGSSVFIPKGTKHRLINTDPKEHLIITEVQIGDYLGEDDIIRYMDDYNRI